MKQKKTTKTTQISKMDKKAPVKNKVESKTDKKNNVSKKPIVEKNTNSKISEIKKDEKILDKKKVENVNKKD